MKNLSEILAGALLCGALAFALTPVTTSAADMDVWPATERVRIISESPMADVKAVRNFSTPLTTTTFITSTVSILCKTENGVTLYSTDGGETWSEDAPEHLAVLPKIGTFVEGDETFYSSFDSFAFFEGSGSGIQIKIEDGVTLYSTDGGETWGEEVPEGMTIHTDMFGEEGDVAIAYSFKINEDSFTDLPDLPLALPFASGNSAFVTQAFPRVYSEGNSFSIMIKIENDVVLYSTDGGETWSENIPEGMHIITDETATSKITPSKVEVAEKITA